MRLIVHALRMGKQLEKKWHSKILQTMNAVHSPKVGVRKVSQIGGSEEKKIKYDIFFFVRRRKQKTLKRVGKEYPQYHPRKLSMGFFFLFS